MDSRPTALLADWVCRGDVQAALLFLTSTEGFLRERRYDLGRRRLERPTVRSGRSTISRGAAPGRRQATLCGPADQCRLKYCTARSCFLGGRPGGEGPEVAPPARRRVQLARIEAIAAGREVF